MSREPCSWGGAWRLGARGAAGAEAGGRAVGGLPGGEQASVSKWKLGVGGDRRALWREWCPCSAQEAVTPLATEQVCGAGTWKP